MVWRVIVGWLLRFVVAPAAVILVTFFALAFCARYGKSKADEPCETIRIAKGEADYLVAYRKEGAWWLSAPGEQGSKVHEGQILVMEPDAQLGVVLVLDAKGEVHTRAYDWNIRSPQKRFCLK
jgi:hypothetical protein